MCTFKTCTLSISFIRIGHFLFQDEYTINSPFSGHHRRLRSVSTFLWRVFYKALTRSGNINLSANQRCPSFRVSAYLRVYCILNFLHEILHKNRPSKAYSSGCVKLFYIQEEQSLIHC